MKAITQDHYGDSTALHYRDIPEPRLTPDRVLIRMRAAGLEMGQWHTMTGRPLFARTFLGLRRPRQRIRGWDYAGIVEAVGSDITHLNPGDEVFGSASGAYAEVLLAKPDQITPKPANLTFEHAATLSTSATTALQALRKAGVAEGQRVLITGAGGGVGHFAVQLAKHLGATVVAICSTAKTDFVRSLGADQVIDYKATDDLGRDYDAIIDIGGGRPVKLMKPLLREHGRLVLTGGEGGGAMFGSFARQLQPNGKQVTGLMASENPGDRQEVAHLAAAGVIRPNVDRVFPLSEAAAAIDLMAAGAPIGKYVLVP